MVFRTRGELLASTAGKRRRSVFPPGFPDLIVLRPGGRFFLIEVKSDRGRLSEAQRQMHAELSRMGFDVLVLRGAAARKQLEEYMREIDEKKRRKKASSSPTLNKL